MVMKSREHIVVQKNPRLQQSQERVGLHLLIPFAAIIPMDASYWWTMVISWTSHMVRVLVLHRS